MDELQQALTKIQEAHAEGVNLAQYLEAESILEPLGADEAIQAIGMLTRICAAQNSALELLAIHLSNEA